MGKDQAHEFCQPWLERNSIAAVVRSVVIEQGERPRFVSDRRKRSEKRAGREILRAHIARSSVKAKKIRHFGSRDITCCRLELHP